MDPAPPSPAHSRPRGRPFEKGRSGNPGGKPKGVQKASNRALKALAEAATPEALRAIAELIVARARAGEVEFIVLLYDRLLGKPRQAVDVDGDVIVRSVTIIVPDLPGVN